jgi:lysophospholipid acyltransferase (LPLAT)-like uncharacterized protein
MKIKARMIAWAGAGFIRHYFKLCRIEIFGQDSEKTLRLQREDLSYTGWHRGFIFFAHMFRDRNGWVMVSKSRDGELISSVLNRLGFYTARGSSSRGGKAALQELIDYTKQGHPSGLVADGPTGPPYKSKMGIIMLAARTGSPLLPVAWDASPSLEFNSWDRTILPLPFSRIVFIFDHEPINVAEGLSEEEYEKIREHLENRLNHLTFQARAYVKNKMHGIDPREIPVPDNYMDYLPRKKKKKIKD